MLLTNTFFFVTWAITKKRDRQKTSIITSNNPSILLSIISHFFIREHFIYLASDVFTTLLIRNHVFVFQTLCLWHSVNASFDRLTRETRFFFLYLSPKVKWLHLLRSQRRGYFIKLENVSLQRESAITQVDVVLMGWGRSSCRATCGYLL